MSDIKSKVYEFVEETVEQSESPLLEDADVFITNVTVNGDGDFVSDDYVGEIPLHHKLAIAKHLK
ncbi:MAG TPA: hypothetical protein VGD05_14075 [Pyrinomonadaceae bacterium]|jgi:hypothetical protein